MFDIVSTIEIAAAAMLALTSGLAWGLHEKISHHWWVFSRRFPSANPRFWNPDVSWINKYRDRETSKGIVPIFRYVDFSDAKHILASLVQVAAYAAGIVTGYEAAMSWKLGAVCFLAVYVMRSIGNRITWSWLYK